MSNNVIAFPSPHRTRHSGAPTRSSLPSTPHDAKSRDPEVSHVSGNQPEDGRRKKDALSRSIEPNIQEIRGKNGTASYRVQIRKSVNGKAVSFTRTFSSLKFAKKWKLKKLAEIELQGVDFVAKSDKKVSDAIDARIATHRSLGRSAIQQLTWVKESYFGNKKLCDLTMEDLLDLADFMLAEERLPQTVAGYLTILVKTLDWASRRKFIVPVATLRNAMFQMWEDEILARSEERNRRPTLDELDAILGAISMNKRQRIPLDKVTLFAIFSCRRLGEICRLRWEDLRAEAKEILVRDMKHPRKKKGNDVWCKLTDEALAVILSMPKVDKCIFPFKPASVGTAWQRHRDRLGIKDLRFHDLRHEGITRLFEMGKPAAFVAKHSGHKNGGCLFRYEHVEVEGDKFAGWAWTPRASTDPRE